MQLYFLNNLSRHKHLHFSEIGTDEDQGVVELSSDLTTSHHSFTDSDLTNSGIVKHSKVLL